MASRSMPRRRRNRSRSSISRTMARSIGSSCSTIAASQTPSARPSSSPVRPLPLIGTRPAKWIRTRWRESDASDRSPRGPNRTPLTNLEQIFVVLNDATPRRWPSPRWRRRRTGQSRPCSGSGADRDAGSCRRKHLSRQPRRQFPNRDTVPPTETPSLRRPRSPPRRPRYRQPKRRSHRPRRPFRQP